MCPAKRGGHHAAVFNRTQYSRRGQTFRGGPEGHFAEVVQVLNAMGPQIQWVHSYVTGDQIFCVYRAPNEEMVREHARQGGFPADKVSEIKTTINPTTAE